MIKMVRRISNKSKTEAKPVYETQNAIFVKRDDGKFYRIFDDEEYTTKKSAQDWMREGGFKDGDYEVRHIKVRVKPMSDKKKNVLKEFGIPLNGLKDRQVRVDEHVLPGLTQGKKFIEITLPKQNLALEKNEHFYKLIPNDEGTVTYLMEE